MESRIHTGVLQEIVDSDHTVSVVAQSSTACSLQGEAYIIYTELFPIPGSSTQTHLMYAFIQSASQYHVKHEWGVKSELWKQ